jgi:hypothetical protein
MKKIIIGIHGLKNKSPREILENWWKKSILEGFQNHGLPELDFQVELVYWADLNYEKPLDPQVTDKKDSLFLEYPYIPATEIEELHEDHNFKRKVLDRVETGLDKLFLHEKGIGGLEAIADLAIRRKFIDLDIYYHGKCRVNKQQIAKNAFRNRLAEVLKKYKRKKILLIAHSMGSIISYDALTQVIPGIKVDTIITAGSPLGLPIILKKILTEQHQEIDQNSKPSTPQNIRKAWYNFSDLNDKIAFNYNLADDYSANTRGVIPQDILVENNYKYNGQKNSHKVYGYLRSSQMAEVIYNFLRRKENFFSRVFQKAGLT